MSRSGYCEDEFDWHTIMYRGAVASAIRGKRGQAFLLEMWKAMKALPEPKLIRDALEVGGAVCAIGAVGRARGIDMSPIDPDDNRKVAEVFGISPALAAEIVFMNDEVFWRSTPEERYASMLRWIEKHLLPVEDPTAEHTLND